MRNENSLIIEQASLAALFSFSTSLAISFSTGFACKVIIIITNQLRDIIIPIDEVKDLCEFKAKMQKSI